MAFDPAAIETAITNAIIGLIPFFGPAFVSMTPEQKQAFVLQLAEVIARGAAAGMVQGMSKNNSSNGIGNLNGIGGK